MSETALITGASSGLGMEHAKWFAQDNRDVARVARRRDRLHPLANEVTGKWGIKAYVIAEDLVDPAAPQRIAEEVKRDGLQIDYLVNNAGFGATGPFAEVDLARELAMVQVNITALVALTRAFLPEMIQRKRGRVLNIGSTAGFQPGPFMAVYYANQALVHSFSQALLYDLRGPRHSPPAS